jgi:hypothetical protein
LGHSELLANQAESILLLLLTNLAFKRILLVFVIDELLHWLPPTQNRSSAVTKAGRSNKFRAPAECTIYSCLQ